MRTSGILLSISSLPSKYGIGTLGEEAFNFIDFLKEAKQTYWQILPIGPTSYGDSPYQTFSAFAGNPYFVDIDLLIKDGLLTEDDLKAFDFEFDPEKVDYGKIYNQRFDILKLAFNSFDINDESYLQFLNENHFWLDNYSLFMALKKHHNGVAWSDWQDCYKFRDAVALEKFIEENQNEIHFWNFIQYEFFTQWSKLKKYANDNGIKIIGDIAIYVAYDSSDVWERPENYRLNKKLDPIEVAGCPPDAFTEDGQLWGNPIYNWKYMKNEGYSFWVERMKKANTLFDLTRIDHFRGFAGYYSIPYGDETAKNGKWNKGPGYSLFKKIKEELGDIPIIAEDLGFITDDVRDLLKKTGFPGMKLIMFGFDSDGTNEHLPHNYQKNCVCYAGTHDNNPICGWIKEIDEPTLKNCMEYLNTDGYGICYNMVKEIFKSVADYAIITMQDLLYLDEKARMNTPSKVGSNWVWRMKKEALTDELSERLKHYSYIFNRNLGE